MAPALFHHLQEPLKANSPFLPRKTGSVFLCQLITANNFLKMSGFENRLSGKMKPREPCFRQKMNGQCSGIYACFAVPPVFFHSQNLLIIQ